jgi:hypothetical protein
MIPVPSGIRVWLASGYTDMRKGFDGLAMLVQESLKHDPHGGQLFVFRGKRGEGRGQHDPSIPVPTPSSRHRIGLVSEASSCPTCLITISDNCRRR